MFSPDSKIMQIAGRITDLILLDFLYLITIAARDIRNADLRPRSPRVEITEIFQNQSVPLTGTAAVHRFVKGFDIVEKMIGVRQNRIKRGARDKSAGVHRRADALRMQIG